MSLGLNFKNVAALTNPMLIADPYNPAGGSVDSNPSMTTVNNLPVSAALELQATDGGLLLSRMNNVQEGELNAVPGLTLFNSTLNQVAVCLEASPAAGSSGFYSYCLLQANVTLIQSQIQGMYATPVNIIPAFPGYSIYVLNATFINSFNTAAFQNGGVAVLQWGNAAHGAGTNALANTISAAFINNGSSVAIQEQGVFHSNITGTSGLGLYLSNQTGAFTNGNANSLIQVIVTYFLGLSV